MENSITEKQNTEDFLEYLASASYLYGKAKIILGWQIFLIVFVSIAFSILTIFHASLKIWAVAYGITLSILDALILESRQNSLKIEGAKTQELFDCKLFDMEWRGSKLGNKPDKERIVETAKLYNGQPKTNWYSQEVGNLPLHQAIIACQRSNCWWDAKLRQRYNNWIQSILLIAILITVVIGIYNNLSFPDLILSVFAPVSPAILWSIREIRKQKLTCETLDKLKKHSESLWEKTKNSDYASEKIKQESRFLQDEIYDHRRSCPLIFDWFYKLLHNEQEEQMNKGVKELVNEVISKQ